MKLTMPLSDATIADVFRQWMAFSPRVAGRQLVIHPSTLAASSAADTAAEMGNRRGRMLKIVADRPAIRTVRLCRNIVSVDRLPT